VSRFVCEPSLSIFSSLEEKQAHIKLMLAHMMSLKFYSAIHSDADRKTKKKHLGLILITLCSMQEFKDFILDIWHPEAKLSQV